MANVYSSVGVHDSARAEVQAELTNQEQEWFELQPIEKRLISYSLGLGLGLLVIFVVAFGVIH